MFVVIGTQSNTGYGRTEHADFLAYSNTAYPMYDTTGLACRRRLKIEKEIFSIRFWYRDQFHLNIAITTVR